MLEEAILPEHYEKIKKEQEVVDKMKELANRVEGIVIERGKSANRSSRSRNVSGRRMEGSNKKTQGPNMKNTVVHKEESFESLMIEKKERAEKNMGILQLDSRKWKWVPSRAEKTEFREVKSKEE